MTKKNIDKIIATATPLKKILLIYEDLARGRYSKDRLLTNDEFKQLMKSFLKDNDIDLWNKFLRTEHAVSNALTNLQGGLFEAKMHYSNLRGYILNWNTIEHSEILVNSILHEIKDPIERKKIAEKGSEFKKIFFTKIATDEEGYVDIKIKFDKYNYKDTDLYSLWYVMNNVKKEITQSVIKWISWEKALKDYIRKQGFNIKTYKDKIQDMRDEIDTPIIGWSKFYGELQEKIVLNPNIHELLKEYAICPKIEELKIDKKEYDFFMNKISENE
ncbi:MULTISPECIES: hypothetical protein [Tenacibaculum]|uniref:hypothetical protein n=1 Tax=Tenacibaculum TaxID=104267 RepID=UPI00187BB01C|nr:MULTISPECIES: hypothetical protein [Tenacibaculum]MCD8425952.1 hypothetical protein [Tenacibaculum dicentrarchi]MBE7688956.1 hypothetical protein [Tenacibaculum finnmarkense genomovar ulcerans]MBE7693593.1 hypothetical protein [Tenacibaculum finnmarkense genomovar finnmarkense]MCD8411009.1 hypothetical protein [Tenacibaculum finnmarkense genomovar ulcerans]MCG8184398.1 hypothetical protein [Tenacibaculum piscium]